MKKAISKAVIIVGSVLLALAIAIVILCAVRTRPADALTGYSRAEVYGFGATDRIEVDASKSELFAAIGKGIDSCSFSVMQGILEGKAGGGRKFKTDADGARVELASTEIASVASTGDRYKLVLVYPQPKTVTVENETIEFDRAIVLVGDSENEIRTLEVVFYLDARIDNQAADENLSSEYYSVSPVIIRARTTKLFNALADVVASRA